MSRAPATKWHPTRRAWHGTRGKIRRNVIHTQQGHAAGTLSWFNSAHNPYRTGAHFVYSLKDTYQTAELSTLLWHCRNANQDGVGHELDGFAEQTKRQWLSKKNRTMLRMCANRVAWVCYTQKLGSPKRGKNVFGHGDVPGNDHTDPGKGFPWTFFMWLCRRAYKNLVKSKGRKWT